jgi:hypothetical protein
MYVKTWKRLDGLTAMKEEEAVPPAINSKELSAKLTPTFFFRKFLTQSVSCFIIVLLYESHEAPPFMSFCSFCVGV